MNNNTFGYLLNEWRKAKERVTNDMTDSLLRKHPDYSSENIVVQEIMIPEGGIAVRVSLRQGFDDIDWQTAQITCNIHTHIIPIAVVPDHHPDYEKIQDNNQKQEKLEREW